MHTQHYNQIMNCPFNFSTFYHHIKNLTLEVSLIHFQPSQYKVIFELLIISGTLISTFKGQYEDTLINKA